MCIVHVQRLLVINSNLASYSEILQVFCRKQSPTSMTKSLRIFPLKVKDTCIAVNGTPSHSYGVSLAIWDHTVLLATWHKWTHPTLTSAMQAGTRFTYTGEMEGWVDLTVPRPEVKLATFRSRVQRPTTAPPKQPKIWLGLGSGIGIGLRLKFGELKFGELKFGKMKRNHWKPSTNHIVDLRIIMYIAKQPFVVMTTPNNHVICLGFAVLPWWR